MSGSKILVYFCFLFILGVFAYSFVKSPVNQKASQYYGRQLELKGIIVSEPEQRIGQQKFEFKSEEIPVKALVSAELYPRYAYGDELKIRGEFLEPAIFEDFDYRAYLAKDDIHLVVYYSQIELIGRQQGNWFLQKVFNFKSRLRQIISQNLLPPHSAILRAVFLGDRHGLSDQFKEKLNLTGTRHITAVSGLHIIIWAQLILYLSLALGLWRSQAFYLVSAVLFFYILMIGAPASAVRAGIMAGILLLAQKLGRLRSSGRAILFAASLMLLFNPWLIRSDIGFQLSFAATLSIVYLKPVLDEKLSKIPDSFYLKDILTMTLAAQIGVLGLLVYHFGQVSLISPLANLLIVPFLPGLIILGMFLAVSGLIWPGLAKLAVIPLWLLLSYIVKLVEYLAGLPFAAYQIKGLPLLILIVYYLLLVAYLWRKNRSLYSYA